MVDETFSALMYKLTAAVCELWAAALSAQEKKIKERKIYSAPCKKADGKKTKKRRRKMKRA
jgi:hypothetical protein